MNRLESYSRSGAVTTYGYTPDGKWLNKIQGTNEEWFAYDLRPLTGAGV